MIGVSLQVPMSGADKDFWSSHLPLSGIVGVSLQQLLILREEAFKLRVEKVCYNLMLSEQPLKCCEGIACHFKSINLHSINHQCLQTANATCSVLLHD